MQNVIPFVFIIFNYNLFIIINNLVLCINILNCQTCRICPGLVDIMSH